MKAALLWKSCIHLRTPSSSCIAFPTRTLPRASLQKETCNIHLVSQWIAVSLWSRRDCAPWFRRFRCVQTGEGVGSLCLAPPVRTPAPANIQASSLSPHLWTPPLECLRSPYFYWSSCLLRGQQQPWLRLRPWTLAEPSRGVCQKATRRETQVLTEVCKTEQLWASYFFSP